jgi:hypothetical protein
VGFQISVKLLFQVDVYQDVNHCAWSGLNTITQKNAAMETTRMPTEIGTLLLDQCPVCLQTKQVKLQNFAKFLPWSIIGLLFTANFA